VFSWPHYPSERPGEGVSDLITMEPEQSGSFFLWTAWRSIGVKECVGPGRASVPCVYSTTPARHHSVLQYAEFGVARERPSN
jgi:hypothetical protein